MTAKAILYEDCREVAYLDHNPQTAKLLQVCAGAIGGTMLGECCPEWCGIASAAAGLVKACASSGSYPSSMRMPPTKLATTL